MRRLACALLLMGSLTGCDAEPPHPAFGDSADDLGLALLMIFFDFDSAKLKPRDFERIEAASKHLKTYGITRVVIEGFADRAGSNQHNQRLSLQRADVVKAELMRRGHSADDIAVVAFGEAKPLVETPDGVREPQNRRIEMRVKCPPGMVGREWDWRPNCR